MNDTTRRDETYNYPHMFILHDNGVIVFTIRSLSRLAEYSDVLRGAITEVDTTEAMFTEEHVADTGFTIMSSAITETGAIVTADTALTKEDITRHLGIISTLTGISLGYCANNATIVYEEQIRTSAGIPTVFPTISITDAIARVKTVFQEEEISRSLAFTSVFNGIQLRHIANTAFLVYQLPLEIYPRFVAAFPVTEAPYINAEFQTVLMEEDANRHLELKTVFTSIRLEDVANNEAVNDGG